MSLSEDPLYLEVSEELQGFCKRFMERLEKGQQKLKACKINNVIQSKLEQEKKCNLELRARLAELSKKDNELKLICSKFESGVKISDNDQTRLDHAKEMYVIGKKLTGIRFDFSAPPDTVKGSYIQQWSYFGCYDDGDILTT